MLLRRLQETTKLRSKLTGGNKRDNEKIDLAIEQLKQLNAVRHLNPDAENDFIPHPSLDINVIRAAVEQAFNGQEERPVTVGMLGNGVVAKTRLGNAQNLQFLTQGRMDRSDVQKYSFASGV